MTTALEIITDALLDIGAIAVGETPTAAESQDGLRRLNRMIDSWKNESLLVYHITNSVFPFVGNQQVYTIGTGGNFNVDRPQLIVDAKVRDPQDNDYPMQILNYDQWAGIISKPTTSTFPVAMYNDKAYPLSSLYFWPTPTDSNYSVSLWYWQQLQTFSTLQTAISLPPGYELALEWNLAAFLSPSYGKPVSSEIMTAAVESKAKIQIMNYEIVEMNTDLPLSDKYTWNWITGDTI